MSNYEIKDIEDDDIGRIIHKEFENQFCERFILVGEDKTCLPVYYTKYIDAIRNLEVHNSDIFICSYPKAGTTWTQEMVWLIANDLDYEGAKASLRDRTTHFEQSIIFDYEKLFNALGSEISLRTQDSVAYLSRQSGQRFIKTHLPASLLPEQIKNGLKTPKIIYVIRNPKDVCVSYYHLGKLTLGWPTSFENFCKVFLADRVLYGSFWKHVLGYWELRSSPNVLIIRYEDMKKDLPSVIQKVGSFLGKKGLTDEQMELLCKHLSFDSMKNNKAINFQDFIDMKKAKNLVIEDGSFLRSGTVGKYKDELSPEMIERFNEWTKQNIAGTDFGRNYDYNV